MEKEHEKIFYRNKKELEGKIARIKAKSLSELQILSDFDRTITPEWLKGKYCWYTMGVFRAYHRTINSKFYEEDQKLFDYY